MTDYFQEIQKVIEKLDQEKLDEMYGILQLCRGRLFILGVGGSAANASHAVNDFRKLADIQAYAPTDNVAELTAITNDFGWEYVFVHWLETNQLTSDDIILVFSVGGGNEKVSRNIVKALDYAVEKGCVVLGITGPEGGYTAKVANVCIKLPIEKYITPIVESMQSIIWHYIVNKIHG
jgi:D-sedoheptulose 7-phosphate isomerase